ncbi:MAG TPA: TetR/AcrR family transcriptional regulator [Burkholderiales bacterium]|nr:TetR/AcrR family transcriptional regulator [Burkholderiales bacterium]
MSTSKHRKRRYHHGDLRVALLRTAGKILEKERLEALTLRTLARRTGVSHAAPYRHFRDRESLLAALAAEGFAMLGKAQREAAAAAGLRGMGEAYVRFALEQPQRFRLMFGGEVPIGRHPALREVATRAFDALSGALAAHVPEARGARDQSIAAWALVHGLAQLLLEGRVDASARGDRSEAQFTSDVLATVRFAAGSASRAPVGAAPSA